MTDLELINKAKESLLNSYAPYSRFNVGAAVLTTTGKIYTGCNIENASFGATICAERVALFKAISEGENEFEKMAIVSKGENSEFSEYSDNYTYPCGICRQVMTEFMKNGHIILQNKTGNVKKITVSELNPFSFGN